MNGHLAQRMDLLKTETAFAILARAKQLEAQGRDIVHLEIGQPDFKTPGNIIEAAYAAMKNGYTGYTPTPGLPEAREAIAAYCRRHKKVNAKAENVIIVPGGKPIMFYTMLMLINPGDEVIYPNPGFPIYESCIAFAGGKPVPMPILEENDFSIDIEKFKQLITDKTKLVIINSPANPTGGIYSKEDILSVADAVKGKGIFVMSDEIYDRIVFDGEPFSIATVPGMEDYTIILDGFSKTYAMTGWRLGYGVMHPDLVKRMELLMVNSNSCAASFSQMAAIEALNGPQDAVEEMVAAFKERGEYLAAALNSIPGISCRTPKGAFYVFPNVSRLGLSSAEFADRLLNEVGVAGCSGTAFGSYGEGYVRLSSANSMENIKKAVERVEKFTKSL